MSLLRPYKRFGDKKNSPYFEEYLTKIYDWRDSVGLVDMVQEMHSIVVEVDESDRHAYIEELMIMTPYHYVKSFENKTFIYSLLEIGEKNPGFVIRSRKNHSDSRFISMNMLSPAAMTKPYTRYIGEVFRVSDIDELQKTLSGAGVEFTDEDQVSGGEVKFIRTVPSQYTWNTIAYIQYPKGKRQYYLEQNPEHIEDEAWIEKLQGIKNLQNELGIGDLIQPIDHLATRVLHQDREHAILELLKTTSYHYWGSYDIADQNSSTNVTRNSNKFEEYRSPAKVFTAANTPHYVDNIVHLPSPTEAFVRNYGKRMHHIAYSVADNTPGQDVDNVDKVVDALKNHDVEFLLKVIGSSEEGLKQIFSRTSKFSFLITEYVQRFNGFQGFFTKKNVAFLTKAAGEDSVLKSEGRVGEGDLSD
ncbi:MAG: hypothetical protein P1V18_02760 [Candidatus Gracilibacteria bacterium]|nr:hypothetical protein [Candidatus Gracilibacteria bacterium]